MRKEGEARCRRTPRDYRVVVHRAWRRNSLLRLIGELPAAAETVTAATPG